MTFFYERMCLLGGFIDMPPYLGTHIPQDGRGRHFENSKNLNSVCFSDVLMNGH